MLRNYIKIAWRNISNQKAFTAINVLGLSLGLCSCIVIYTICSYEFSFDTFHPGNERIYRVMADVTENTGNKLHFARLPLGVSRYGRKELSGIDVMAGIIPYNAGITVPGSKDNAKQYDSRKERTRFVSTAIVEPDYFAIFKYEWLAGNGTTALRTPSSVVLTETKAKQYFGNTPVNEIIGKQLLYDDSLTLNVAGIVKDQTKNTDLAFTDFISFATVQSGFLKNKINTDLWEQKYMNTWTFVRLSRNASAERVENQMAGLVKRHAGSNSPLVLGLEPLSEMHFNADVIENPIRTANKPTLHSLIAIAVFILVLAIINFVNLSTAQSLRRAKEVGIRKVMGCNRAKLVVQFLTETLLLTVLSVSLAILLVKPVLAAFQSFLPAGVTFKALEPSMIFFLVAITLLTTVWAGFYPAKILSAHLPVISLKGTGVRRSSDVWWLRKGLIIFQFTVSLVFITCSIVMAKQLAFTRNKDRGFNADAIISVATPPGGISTAKVLASKIRQLQGVDNVALQWLPPMTSNGRAMQLKFHSTDTKEIEVGQVAGNEDFIPLYQIKIVAGRNLLPADSVKELVINESLAKRTGSKAPQEAIGKILYWNDKPYPVVGVVADFHSGSFHDPIQPLCIVNRPDRESSLAVKLATKGKLPGVLKSTLLQIETEWKRIYPAGIFTYDFYDESLELLYEKDRQTATLIDTAMLITLSISSIGLFGLALFTTKKRAKEISIRKIVGASISRIAIMLGKDFVVLIIVSLLIASPVAWYLMNRWLNGFAYRIRIEWWMFIVAGLAAMIIAAITTGFQTIRAALANPVNSLRTE